MTETATDPGFTGEPPEPAEDLGDVTGSWGLAAVVFMVLALGLLGGVAWVVVVLSLVFMIFMHELGHYLTARWSGMKVTEFFIGFGPRLWSFRRGETEYGIKAIWAGAYVRIIGMNNLEEVDPADEPRTYRQQSYPKRLMVVSAGSAMHFLMALVLLFILFVGFGLRNPEKWEVAEIVDGGAAQAMGLEAGDRITAIDGVDVDTFLEAAEIIGASPNQEIVAAVLRDGETVELVGTIGESELGEGRLGFIYSSALDEVERQGPITAAGTAVDQFGELTVQSVKGLVSFFSRDGLSSFFSAAVQGDSEPVVEAGGAGAGGEPVASGAEEDRILSIYGAARLGETLTREGIDGLFLFLALINVFVGVFNLVPLLPLDGGHVVVATYERLRSWGGRRHHADVAKLLPLTYMVVFTLMAVGLVALYRDITDPIGF